MEVVVPTDGEDGWDVDFEYASAYLDHTVHKTNHRQ